MQVNSALISWVLKSRCASHAFQWHEYSLLPADACDHISFTEGFSAHTAVAEPSVAPYATHLHPILQGLK
jgi:hypothetical protein